MQQVPAGILLLEHEIQIIRNAIKRERVKNTYKHPKYGRIARIPIKV